MVFRPVGKGLPVISGVQNLKIFLSPKGPIRIPPLNKILYLIRGVILIRGVFLSGIPLIIYEGLNHGIINAFPGDGLIYDSNYRNFMTRRIPNSS